MRSGSRRVVSVASFDRRPDARVGPVDLGACIGLVLTPSNGTTEFSLTLDCGHVVHRHGPIGRRPPRWAVCGKCE